MKKKTRQPGFTIIELVIVITIIGILALIAVPKLTGFTDQAKQAADKAAAATIAKACEMYNATKGDPTNLPTPQEIFTASLVDEKVLIPQYNISTNKGYCVEMENGAAKVYYSDGTSGKAALTWGAKPTTPVKLYPAD